MLGQDLFVAFGRVCLKEFAEITLGVGVFKANSAYIQDFKQPPFRMVRNVAKLEQNFKHEGPKP